MIRVASSDELAALSALALRSKAYWGYSDAFMLACRDELTVTRDLLPYVFVKQTEQGIAGFYALSELDPGRAELEFLFIEPWAMRRGYGREFVVHARQLARSRRWRVIVIQGDPNAANFYGGVGAVEVGERPSASIPGRMLPLYELAC